MNDLLVRRNAIAEWLMEFSVLWAVFPLLDMPVERRPLDARIIAASVAISLTTGLAGLILMKGERK